MAVFICQACGAEHSAESGKCPECGATQTIRLSGAEDRMIGRVIKAKYKIVSKLGQGGMGSVYLGEQLGIGHQVALKFLKSEFSLDAEIARRFLNEAKSYARVAHPNAVTLHDFGQDEEGNLFIAMEYCEGVDLKRAISDQHHLPIGEAIEVVLQVADVLANAHSKGVVHRDLKPENIMIRRGMRGVHAKVLDFGIARLMNAGTRLTVAGAIAGTPRYMSPEQVDGREADARADIYSLGIVLYETITGVQPFDGNTIAEILRRQVTEPMPRLADANPDLNFADLDGVIQKATAKKREDRWPDMLTFAGALVQAMPTQVQLSVPALQRSGFSQVNATPAADSSLLQQPTELELTGPTMIKAPTGVGALSPRSLKAGLHTELAPSGAAVPDESMAPRAPKSSAPFVVVGALTVVLVGAGAWAVFGRSEAVQPSVSLPELERALVDAGASLVVAPSSSGELEVATVATRKIQDAAAYTALGQGRTAFDLAKLDEAKTFLSSIENNTKSFAEAQELLSKIQRIRDRLKVARDSRARGDCSKALPVYQEVLRLNPKLTEASEGAKGCRAGIVDTTMEP